MNAYIKGFIKNLKNPAINIVSLVDDKSYVNKLAKINRFAHIVNSSIGRYSYIGISTHVNCAEIGNFCSIASDVYIGLEEHTISYISTSPIFTEAHNGTGYSWVKDNLVSPSKKTVIGHDVWIGFRALIKAGITIGNGAIVGAGAIVTHDVPPYSVVVGIPAKVKKYRFSKEIINTLESLSWWDWEEEILKNNISMFQYSLGIQADEILNKINTIRSRGREFLDELFWERRTA